MRSGGEAAARVANEALVSVVIPTRDRSALLQQAIDAVLGQTHRQLEVVIVDDASTDDTANVIASAAARDDRVRSVRHPDRRGAAAARNTGAELAGGSFVLFEDDDCLGRPHRIERLLAALDGEPAAGFAFCWAEAVEPQGGTTVVKGTGGAWTIGTPAALLRADAFREAGGFDPELPRLQDFDLWVRLMAAHSVVEVPEVLFAVRRGENGISASSDRLSAAAGLLLRKYRTADLPRSHLARMHRHVGGHLAIRGRVDEARVHFRRALRLSPLNGLSWLALIASLGGQRMFRWAVRLKEGSP